MKNFLKFFVVVLMAVSALEAAEVNPVFAEYTKPIIELVKKKYPEAKIEQEGRHLRIACHTRSMQVYFENQFPGGPIRLSDEPFAKDVPIDNGFILTLNMFDEGELPSSHSDWDVLKTYHREYSVCLRDVKHKKEYVIVYEYGYSPDNEFKQELIRLLNREKPPVPINPVFSEYVKPVVELVKQKYPEAKIEQKERELSISYHTLPLQIHGRAKGGLIDPKPHTEDVPNGDGFVINVNCYEGVPAIQARTPSGIDAPYSEGVFDLLTSKDQKVSYFSRYEYGWRPDQEFRKEVIRLLGIRSR